jgi:hypothetical protein
MKLTFITIFLSILSLIFGNFSAQAQVRSSSSGKVTKTDNQTTPTNTDITKVDFTNFTFPDLFAGKTEKSFTLKNGQFRASKLSNARVFTLRKTYYFDITGDEKDEAITQIIAETCTINCESQSLFYVHTIENNQPKLIWKIATGTAELGGLKSVNFNIKEIVLETFGNVSLDNSLIKSNVDIKKTVKVQTIDFTKFVFSLSDKGFASTSKETLPLKEKYTAEYRPQISFGSQD